MTTDTQTTDLNTKNRIAAGFMFLTVFFWSLTPLFVSISGSQQNPLWFTTITRIAEATGCIILLLLLKQELFSYQVFKKIITGTKKIKVTHHLAIAAFSCIDLVMFSVAIRFVDISTATLFYELWTIVFIFWASFLFRSENKYKRLTANSYILLFVAFLGSAFILMAESGTNPFLGHRLSWQVMTGASIAFMAGVIAAAGTEHIAYATANPSKS